LKQQPQQQQQQQQQQLMMEVAGLAAAASTTSAAAAQASAVAQFKLLNSDFSQVCHKHLAAAQSGHTKAKTSQCCVHLCVALLVNRAAAAAAAAGCRGQAHRPLG
jgi:hypothetical protein